MPIITTPGQDTHSTVPQTSNTPVQQPLPVQAPVQNQQQTSPISRIQSMKQPMAPKQVLPVDDLDDDDLFGDEDDELSGETATHSAPPTPATKGISLSRMGEDERKSVILKAFTLILGREPADRDYSYYRFSTLTEEGLLKSLLSLPEHKQLLDNAREAPALKQRFAEVDLRLKQSEEMLKSMHQELNTLQLLLDEKNRHIHQLRTGEVLPISNKTSTYVAQSQSVAPQSQGEPVGKHQQGVEVKTLPTPMDEVKSLFSSFFGRGRK